MFKKSIKKPSVRIFLGLLSVLIAIAIIMQFMAKSQVKNFLVRKLPQHVQLEYKNMDVNVLTGTIGLRNIALNFYDRDSMLLNTKVKMDAIRLEGLGYWDFLVNKEIDVDRLTLERPEVLHYPDRVLRKEEDEPQGVVQLLKTIKIGELAVESGRLALLREARDSITLSIQDINFMVEDARTGPEQIANRIPVEYGAYELEADSLYVNLGRFNELEASSILWNRDRAKITGLNLRSKYDKAELSRRLTTQYDHIDLSIPEMSLDSIQFGFRKDTFFITTGSGTIHRPDAEIYRDKMVPDDDDAKKLYSRSLRELPIHLNVPKIEIIDGNVVYSERVADVEHLGKLSFERLNATISNLSNTYPAGERTVIEARTQFMGYAKMTLDWSFDVNNTNGAFMAAGTVSNFDTESINAFLRSNLRAKASGTIDQMYFTIDGDAVSSFGDMKMKYNDFEFQVLKKNRLGINTFLTAVGNIFVNSGTKTDAEGFRYGDIEVERDPTKSFFSYLWANVRDGSLSTLTGNGKKEE